MSHKITIRYGVGVFFYWLSDLIWPSHVPALPTWRENLSDWAYGKGKRLCGHSTPESNSFSNRVARWRRGGREPQ